MHKQFVFNYPSQSFSFLVRNQQQFFLLSLPISLSLLRISLLFSLYFDHLIDQYLSLRMERLLQQLLSQNQNQMFFYNEQPIIQGFQGQWYMIPVLCPGNTQFPHYFPSAMVNQQYAVAQNSEITSQKSVDDNIKQNSSFVSSKQKKETQEKISVLEKGSKKERKIRIGNLAKEDQEFQPQATIEKGKRRTPQNLNRNVFPNIVHQVFSFLQKKSKSEDLVSRLLQAENAKQIGSVKRFYLYQGLIKDKMHHYVNIQSLQIFAALQDPKCELYSMEEQNLYIMISRIMINVFLKKEFQCIILTSKRVSSDKKFSHLEYRRKLLDYIKQIYIN